MENQMRALPAHPSLDHLRKEAKQLLDILRARANSAQLADAQLMVARTYGFSSWRSLKLEVDQRRQEIVPMLPAINADMRPVGREAARAGTLDPSHVEQAFFALCAMAFAVPASVPVVALAAFLTVVVKNSF